jgi:predicted TIM-barrel fold metal-dependent hydrolase
MPPAKPERAVDCHAHVFSADAPAIAGARYRPDYRASLEAWRDEWKRAGVTHGVLVQPSFFGTDNREMLAALAQAPDRLRGVAVVDPAIGDRELDGLHAAGVRAIRLNLQLASDYAQFRREPWPALFDRIARLGWHVETFVEVGRAAELAAALRDTRVDVVFDHFANPGADPRHTFEPLLALSRNRAVWIKASAPYRTLHGDCGALARQWADVLGDERLVWGSDWPWTRHEAGRDYLAALEAFVEAVGEARARRVLWDNAARLYRFD